MKFPRNARIFRGQLDAAPFVSVFFLLVIFVILRSLLYIPGVRVELPSGGDQSLPGTDRPTISIAVTTNAIYFHNEQVSEDILTKDLSAEVKKTAQPLTLVVQADKDVTEQQVVHLALVARNAGIPDLLLATLPRVFDSPPSPSPKP